MSQMSSRKWWLNHFYNYSKICGLKYSLSLVMKLQCQKPKFSDPQQTIMANVNLRWYLSWLKCPHCQLSRVRRHGFHWLHDTLDHLVSYRPARSTKWGPANKIHWKTIKDPMLHLRPLEPGPHLHLEEGRVSALDWKALLSGPWYPLLPGGSSHVPPLPTEDPEPWQQTPTLPNIPHWISDHWIQGATCSEGGEDLGPQLWDTQLDRPASHVIAPRGTTHASPTLSKVPKSDHPNAPTITSRISDHLCCRLHQHLEEQWPPKPRAPPALIRGRDE